MLRTALLSGVLALAAYGSSDWLTHGFQVWTAEGARRLEVALQPVAPPPVRVEGPGTALQPLPQWLAAPNTVTVVDFIYTRCQTVCLSLGSLFQQLQAEVLQERASVVATGAAPRLATVRLLSLSFDSERDTPAALQAYAQKLQADPSVWQFLRVPEPAGLAKLLRRFEVVVVPDGRGDFEHNAALLVVGPQGRLVRVFDIAERELALNYARHLARSHGQMEGAVGAGPVFPSASAHANANANANTSAFAPLLPFDSAEPFFADRAAGFASLPAGARQGWGNGTGSGRAASSIPEQPDSTLAQWSNRSVGSSP